MLLNGIFPAITTPFYPDGRVYYRKLEHNVDRYARGPIAGMVVLGSTGEAIMLSGEEQREVLKTALAAVAPEKVMIAGTGSESAIETLRLTEYAAQLGYDAALVRTPHYYRPQMSPAALLAFYRTVADQSALPVLLYSVPLYTAYDLPAEVVAELSGHPNILGLKESGGDVSKIRRVVESTGEVRRDVTVTETQVAVPRRMASRAAARSTGGGGLVASESLSTSATGQVTVETVPAIKTRPKSVGFQVLAGSAQGLLPSLQAGAVGGVLAFASAAPTAMFEIYSAWKENDLPMAEQKQKRIVAAAGRVAGELGVPGVKYAMELNGFYGGVPRLPLLALTAEIKLEVETLMRDLE